MSSIIFLLDIIFSILSDVIGLFKTTKESAIAIIVLFSISGALIILPLSMLVLKYLEKSAAGYIAWIFQIILAIAYYYGKNINGIMIRYGMLLGCNESCQRANQFIALTSLLFAILFLTYVIPTLHTIIQKKSKKTYHIFESRFFGVITVLVNANAIFATISLIPANIQCTIYAVVLGSIFLFIITVVAITKICVNYTTDEDNSNDDDDDNRISCFSCSDILPIISYLLLLMVPPVYLLGNNQLPLVYISCNSTGEVVTDNGGTIDHIVRLACMGITGMIVLLALFLFWRNRKNNRTATL